ncbi:protein sax-3-like [Galendromus occidentalis]|uniref:Protein sax-3-like n=1 Tax=Galendromus occidentalis TaxID=34638 RepID=A0AAJ7SFS4_9ACAR|nr:protein sax-3-like [Galendromus occidentalis]
MTVVKAEQGGSTGLPCDIDSYLDDEPIIIRWFRANSTAPFYIIEDSHTRGIWNANHDISIDFAGRAYFSALSSPATLKLSRLFPADAGSYSCVVKFHSGEVRVHNMSLIVGVSPSKPVLTDGDGSILAPNIGPYYAGHNLRLNCIVEKGFPVPSLLWKRNGQLISGQETKYKIMFQPRPEGAHSVLDVGRLTRDELKATFACETFNNILENPLFTSVTVDLILPPLSVEVEHAGNTYDAGAQAEFRCRVTGSRPFPVVTWILATRKLEAYFSHISDNDDGNTTVSTLLLTMSPVEDQQKLTCKVTNYQLPGSTWEDSIQLNILHPPVVSLHLRHGQSVEHISQGQDVALDCSVSSNPPASRVFWTLNDRVLNPTELDEVSSEDFEIVGKQMLLRNVSVSKHNGRYNCDVTNSLGSVRSNDLDLRVKYPPKCHSTVVKNYRYGTTKVPLAVRCQMDADPADNLSFTWIAYNATGSRDWRLLHPSEQQIINGSTSVLSYTPAFLNEEITIECWANNTVNSSSQEKQPCVFHIEPYGVPTPLEGCQVVNQAQSWFFLECDSSREDVDRSKEFYLLEVFNADTQELFVNITSDEPVFQVGDIPDATECIALVFAVNEKGRSEPSRVIVQAISPPSKLLTSGVGVSVTAITSLIVSLVLLVSVALS